MAEDVIDAEPNDALLDLVKGAYGSPFVFIELLSGLRDEDLIRVVAGRAELVEARLPRAGADRRLGVAGELPGRRRLVPGASAWQELSSLPKERQGPASGPAVEHARGHS